MHIMLAFSSFSSLTLTAHYKQVKKTEIANFVKLKIQPNNADRLGWWRNNAEWLPLLKWLFSKYLCVSATSASSERSFSYAGSTATKDLVNRVDI